MDMDDDQNLSRVQHLLDGGEDVNSKDRISWTHLHWAARQGHFRTAVFLVDHGADISSTNMAGQTPLHQAAQYDHVQIAVLLLEHGADISSKDRAGYTALHWASQDGRPQMAVLLLEHGADINSRENAGQTALHLAAQYGQFNMAVLLLRRGADINSQDDRGETPLSLGAKHDRVEIAKLLLKDGADISLTTKSGLTINDVAVSERIKSLLDNPRTIDWKARTVEAKKSQKQFAPRGPATEEQRGLCKDTKGFVTYYFDGKSQPQGDMSVDQLIYKNKLNMIRFGSDAEQDVNLNKELAYRWIHLPLNNASTFLPNYAKCSTLTNLQIKWIKVSHEFIKEIPY
jgi:ankyrin repeat protein